MKTAHALPLRRPLTQAERETCLWECYNPRHACLTNMAQKAVEAHGQCLIIDAHSFPFHTLSCDQVQTPERPDICIGTDPYHTPQALSARAVAVCEAADFSVSRNAPYAGSIVPLAFYDRDKRVMSPMVEVNRRLYMDEYIGMKLAEFADLRDRLQQ